MPEPALLALSLDACAYLPRDAAPRASRRVPLPAQRAAWPAQVFSEIAAPTTAFNVVLADSAVKYFVVAPPQGLQRFSELRNLAQMRAAELFGSDSAQWRISGDWNPSQPFLCCAVPNDLLAPLIAYVGTKLLSAAPIFVRRYNAAAAQLRGAPAWFVCRAGGWVSAGYFEGSACRSVRSTALAQPAALGRWLGQEALLANLPLTEVWLAQEQAQDGRAQDRQPQDRHAQDQQPQDQQPQDLVIAGANVRRIATRRDELRDLELLGQLATSEVPA